LAWLQKARLEAAKITCPAFGMDSLKRTMKEISNLSNADGGVKKLIASLNASGVKFVRVSHLEKTFIDGAAFLDGGNPVIAYTGRYDRLDNFWFTVTHEIAHITAGHISGARICRVDSIDHPDLTDPKETEANIEAGKILDYPLIEKHFAGRQRISEKAVLAFSAENNINPAIVTGCLQYRKILPYASLRHLLVKVSQKLDSAGVNRV
jgi:HTH-type transcriptional regulator/antitoxin HigA